MGKIWAILTVLSIALAIFTGKAETVGGSLLISGERALRLMLVLGGSVILWSGLIEILRQTGDLARLSRGIRRVIRPLFGGIRAEEAWDAVSLNIAANMLGLGNAATPAGIEAARLLTRPEEGLCGIRGLAMLLALNNSGLQLMPTTVMTMRAAAGAADPADIWLPTLLASGVSTVVAVVLMLVVTRGGERHDKRGTDGAPADRRRDPAPRRVDKDGV